MGTGRSTLTGRASVGSRAVVEVGSGRGSGRVHRSGRVGYVENELV